MLPARLAALLVLPLFGAAVAAEEAAPRESWDPARTHALLVGVLEWADPALAPFPKPGRVDRRLEAVLLRRGVPRENLTFLEDGEATLAACRAALQRVSSASRGEGSTLIVYFAGHGLQEGRRTWLAPSDAVAARPAETAWDVAEIGRTLAETWRGSRLLLLADCCHSGALEQIVAGYDADRARAAASLTSALDCNTSTGNWTFTESVVHAFEGYPRLDADADRRVDYAEAQRHVRREMRFRERQLTLGRRSTGFPATWVLGPIDPSSPPASAPGTHRAGDYVEALWKERWWRAQVLAVEPQRARVHYLGHADSWDEWVALDRLRPPEGIATRVGEKVEIEWRGRWWPGKVLEVLDDFARITYDGFGPEWDEWVPAPRLRPPP
jgi:hypothetical protein